MLAVAAAPPRWICGLLVAGVVVAAEAVQLGVLDEHQVNRFAAFANPDLDPRGAGDNTNQARIAIGSGGVLGKGLFQGTQTSGRFIPSSRPTSSSRSRGRSSGRSAPARIIAPLGLVLWRGLRIASRAQDAFGRLVAAGVVSWFAFQSFVNIGMTLGIMPVTGLPLPFVSYGGSAMFANLLAVGLLQNVHLRSQSQRGSLPSPSAPLGSFLAPGTNSSRERGPRDQLRAATVLAGPGVAASPADAHDARG